MRLRPHDNTNEDYLRSRKLRNEASFVERKVWKVLSVQAMTRGIRFRRQQVIHPYIADFACMAARVLVEIDGPSHDAQKRYDFDRDLYLKKEGYDVLRFANEDVNRNTEAVVETILSYVRQKLAKTRLVIAAPLPNPPREGEGTPIVFLARKGFS